MIENDKPFVLLSWDCKLLDSTHTMWRVVFVPKRTLALRYVLEYLSYDALGKGVWYKHRPNANAENLFFPFFTALYNKALNIIENVSEQNAVVLQILKNGRCYHPIRIVYSRKTATYSIEIQQWDALGKEAWFKFNVELAPLEVSFWKSLAEAIAHGTLYVDNSLSSCVHSA